MGEQAVVVVEKAQVPATCKAESRVPGGGQPPVPVVLDQRQSPPLPDSFPKRLEDTGRIGPAVVDDDHFDVPESLARHALEGAPQHRRPVVCGNNERDLRIGDGLAQDPRARLLFGSAR